MRPVHAGAQKTLHKCKGENRPVTLSAWGSHRARTPARVLQPWSLGFRLRARARFLAPMPSASSRSLRCAMAACYGVRGRARAASA